MTDNKEVKKVEENMDNNNETHSEKLHGDVGIYTGVVIHYFKVQNQFLHPHVPNFRTNEMFKISECISAKHNKER